MPYETNINRFVPGGYIVGPNVNQRFYTRVVTMGDLDRDPIQQAINEANNLGGGQVLVKSGTYIINSDINLYSNIHLIGEDADSVAFDFNGGTNTINAGTVTNTSVEGITFQGKRGPDATNQFVLKFVVSTDCYVQNCKFTDNWGTAGSLGCDILLSSSCQRFAINNNRFLSSGKSIWLASGNGTGDVSISNNYLGTNSSVSVTLEATSRVRIVNNTFDSCFDKIVESVEPTNNFITFSQNSIYNHHATALHLGEGATNFELCSIVGNILEAGTGSGIGIFGTASGTGVDGFSRTSIVGNVIKGFGSEGIKFVGNVSWITMTGNVIRNNGVYGVDLGASTSSNILMCNTFSTNGVGGTQPYIDRTGGNNIVDSTGNYNVV